MDSELRDALTRAAAPAEVGPDERHRVRDAVAADRRRRRTLLVVGGTAAAVMAIAVGVAVVGDGSGRESRPGLSDRGDGGPAQTETWEQVAPSPLAARDQAVAAWTGSEVIVAGGTTADPCPPDADCALPPRSAERADAAAYDPETDAWRALASAPLAFAGGDALWLGDRLLIVSGEVTLTYDPAADTWERLGDVPDYVDGGGLIATADGPVRFAYSQVERASAVTDWRLDLATGEWSPLPHDPFSESYDRSMVWYDGRLWLLSMDVEHHFEAHEGSPSRIAVLDGGAWTVVDEETPDVTYQQRIVAQHGVFVVPAAQWDPDSPNRVFDPGTSEWSTLPTVEAGDNDCSLGPASAGPTWISSGPLLVSADPADAIAAPPCADATAPTVKVWAGDRLFIWGGPNADYDGNVADGWVWTPRPPQ